jgi:hypothetical protein
MDIRLQRKAMPATARRRIGRFAGWLSAALAAALWLAGAAAARPATPAERAALVEAVRRFDTAFRALDLRKVIDFMPPRVLEAIARQTGRTVDEIRVALPAQMSSMLKDVRFDNFAMTANDGVFRELPSGEPYALIPTETLMTLTGGKRAKASSLTLGLMDKGRWYLLRVEGPAQLTVLRQAHPEFATVDVPRGTMEFIEK